MSKVTAEWVETPRPDVILRLPYKSAQVLMEICGSIGGEMKLVREHTDAVYAALSDLGVKNDHSLLGLDVRVAIV